MKAQAFRQNPSPVWFPGSRLEAHLQYSTFRKYNYKTYQDTLKKSKYTGFQYLKELFHIFFTETV